MPNLLNQPHILTKRNTQNNREISGQFNADTYNLLSNNCNNCANAMAEFLTGQGIPHHILELPQRVRAC